MVRIHYEIGHVGFLELLDFLHICMLYISRVFIEQPYVIRYPELGKQLSFLKSQRFYFEKENLPICFSLLS